MANYDKTRWFLVLRLAKPLDDGLNKLLYATNRTAEEFGQPPLYESAPLASTKQQRMPKMRKRGTARGGLNNLARGSIWPVEEKIEDLSAHFHISIAWTLEAPAEDDCKDGGFGAQFGLDDRGLDVSVETLKAKIGNITSSIALSARIDTVNGILSH